jgi:hypothetical protein
MHKIAVCHICWKGDNATATGCEFGHDPLEVIRTACQQDDIGTGVCEGKSGGSPQPTTGTCHQGHLSGECQFVALHETPGK